MKKISRSKKFFEVSEQPLIKKTLDGRRGLGWYWHGGEGIDRIDTALLTASRNQGSPDDKRDEKSHVTPNWK